MENGAMLMPRALTETRPELKFDLYWALKFLSSGNRSFQSREPKVGFCDWKFQFSKPKNFGVHHEPLLFFLFEGIGLVPTNNLSDVIVISSPKFIHPVLCFVMSRLICHLQSILYLSRKWKIIDYSPFTTSSVRNILNRSTQKQFVSFIDINFSSVRK